MKLIISNKALKKALKKIGTIVPKKAVLPTLEYIQITATGNKMQIKSTDLEVTMILDLTMSENVDKESIALVNFHWLKGIVDLHDEEPIMIEALKASTVIHASSGTYNQEVAVRLKDFPVLHEAPLENELKMIASFTGWINAAAAICDLKDETVHWKNKVYLEIVNNHLIITATDSSCLFTHTFDIEASIDKSIMVSHKVIKSLDDDSEMRMYFNEDSYSFVCEGLTIIAKIPEGKFPKYNAILPASDLTNISVDRAEFSKCLEKVKFINADIVSITPGIDKVVMDVKNERGQSAKIELTPSNPYRGSAVEVILSPTKLHLLLSQTNYEKIGLSFQEGRAPFVITNSNDLSYIGLLMPQVKIN